MERKDLNLLIELRAELVANFERLRDYKMNPNAIMKEQEHAKTLHATIVKIDKILGEYVSFK